MRRETADAEARSTQLEAELARMVAAQKEREADLDAKEAALDRQASGSDYLNSPAWQQGCMVWYGLCMAVHSIALHVQLAHESCVEERQADLSAKISALDRRASCKLIAWHDYGWPGIRWRPAFSCKSSSCYSGTLGSS